VLLLGENAQGKTNLLEAVFLLAAGRSERASVDADFIAWTCVVTCSRSRGSWRARSARAVNSRSS